MEELQTRLDTLRRRLTVLVAGGLILSYFIPGFFDGFARWKAAEFVLFLHVFLPCWAWGCYSYCRNQAIDEADQFCRRCGCDLTGLVYPRCPDCDRRALKQKKTDPSND